MQALARPTPKRNPHPGTTVESAHTVDQTDILLLMRRMMNLEQEADTGWIVGSLHRHLEDQSCYLGYHDLVTCEESIPMPDGSRLLRQWRSCRRCTYAEPRHELP